MPGRARQRGAPRRKIKALTGVKHHVRITKGLPERLTWCPATKDPGLDGGEAPRPAHQMPSRPRRRGAPRRKIKALTGVKHHVPEGKIDGQKKDLVQETRSGHLPSVSLHQVFYSCPLKSCYSNSSFSILQGLPLFMNYFPVTLNALKPA